MDDLCETILTETTNQIVIAAISGNVGAGDAMTVNFSGHLFVDLRTAFVAKSRAEAMPGNLESSNMFQTSVEMEVSADLDFIDTTHRELETNPV